MTIQTLVNPRQLLVETILPLSLSVDRALIALRSSSQALVDRVKTGNHWSA